VKPVSLLAPAQRELEEAVYYYETQAPGLGDAFLLKAIRVFDLIKRYPMRGIRLEPPCGGVV